MTPDEASDLAERTLAGIDARVRYALRPHDRDRLAADRERVASDLEGLRQHFTVPSVLGDYCDWCRKDAPCFDARRYAEGLRRTSGYYGEP